MVTILKDKYGRVFNYLRLSITDLCNFNCKYCLPISYNNFSEKYLTVNEIYNLVFALSELGVEKVRLTGGEPTVRKDFFDIAKAVLSIKNIKNLCLTTNGYNLHSIIENIYNIGFSSINVSLDTLDLNKFSVITGRNFFNEVINSIYKACNIGLKIKVNAVLSNFFSFEDFYNFYILVKYKAITVRFIEQMGTLTLKNDFSSHLNSSYIKEFLLNNGWKLDIKQSFSGPAFEFSNSVFCGKLGIINPYSDVFCLSCNRLRVSSDGNIHLCLLSNKNLDLKNMLTSLDKKEILKKFIIDNLSIKEKGHLLNFGQVGLFENFSSIGG